MKWSRISVLALALAVHARVNVFAAEDCSKADNRPYGNLPVCIALDGVTSSTSSATIDTFGYKNLSTQVWADTNSVVTVNFNCRSHPTAPWTPCATAINNPDSSGSSSNYISLARAYQYQVTTTGYASGVIHVTFERYNN